MLLTFFLAFRLFLTPLLSFFLAPLPGAAGGTTTHHSSLITHRSTVVEWLTPQEHDFGEIRLGGTRRVVFRFKNISTEPIVLQTVRTSCGCTAAEWPEAPIAPGEVGEVPIEFDANVKGGFRKKIRVFFDQQKKPEMLWVAGEVI